MRTVLLVLALTAACTGSPHYHRAYTPIAGTARADSSVLYARAVAAMTDRGLTPVTNDKDAGIVVSEWVCSDAMGNECHARYRVRVMIVEGGAYDIAVNCQRNDGSSTAIVANDKTYTDCNAEATRPQMMLDHQAAIGAAMGGR